MVGFGFKQELLMSMPANYLGILLIKGNRSGLLVD